MSAEREDGEEEQRDQATTSLAPSGSNAAAACSVPLDRGQAAAPQEAVSVELPTYFFIFFGLWKDNSGDIISIRPPRSLGMLMLPLWKRCGIIRMLMKTGSKLRRDPLPRAQCDPWPLRSPQ